MPNLDDEIDKLYQLPPDEFTAARNALVKTVRGADATEIRKLQKPNAAAWAVNQLYWKRRSVYRSLIDAAEDLRKAHKSLLAGRSTDLRAAETDHAKAVRAALDEIRGILADAGEPASPATVAAVQETLDALPSGDRPGRLTRPVKRMGFEALTGVQPVPGARDRMPPPKDTTSGRDRKAGQREREAERKRKEQERREEAAARAELRERAKEQKRLEDAKAAERKAKAALDLAQRTFEEAVAAREKLEKRLR